MKLKAADMTENLSVVQQIKTVEPSIQTEEDQQESVKWIMIHLLEAHMKFCTSVNQMKSAVVAAHTAHNIVDRVIYLRQLEYLSKCETDQEKKIFAQHFCDYKKLQIFLLVRLQNYIEHSFWKVTNCIRIMVKVVQSCQIYDGEELSDFIIEGEIPLAPPRFQTNKSLSPYIGSEPLIDVELVKDTNSADKMMASALDSISSSEYLDSVGKELVKKAKYKLIAISFSNLQMKALIPMISNEMDLINTSYDTSFTDCTNLVRSFRSSCKEYFTRMESGFDTTVKTVSHECEGKNSNILDRLEQLETGFNMHLAEIETAAGESVNANLYSSQGSAPAEKKAQGSAHVEMTAQGLYGDTTNIDEKMESTALSESSKSLKEVASLLKMGMNKLDILLQNVNDAKMLLLDFHAYKGLYSIGNNSKMVPSSNANFLIMLSTEYSIFEKLIEYTKNLDQIGKNLGLIQQTLYPKESFSMDIIGLTDARLALGIRLIPDVEDDQGTGDLRRALDIARKIQEKLECVKVDLPSIVQTGKDIENLCEPIFQFLNCSRMSTIKYQCLSNYVEKTTKNISPSPILTFVIWNVIDILDGIRKDIANMEMALP